VIARWWSRFGRIRLAILDESGRLYCAMRGSSPCEVRDGLKVTTVLLGQASLVRRVHRPFIRRDPDRAVASRASQPGYTGVHENLVPSLGMHRPLTGPGRLPPSLVCRSVLLSVSTVVGEGGELDH
jgi:hypothetical protein